MEWNCISGVDPSLQAENRIPGSSQATAAVPKQQKSRSTNSRDERFRSGKKNQCSWNKMDAYIVALNH